MSMCVGCLEDKILVKSHIFSKFLYKDSFDTKHRLLIIHNGKKDTTQQDGIKKILLCKNCEDILSKYEREASRILNVIFVKDFEKNYNNNDLLEYIQSENSIIFFKKFLLSLLWRSAYNDPKIYLGSYRKHIYDYIFDNSIYFDKYFFPIHTFCLGDKNMLKSFISFPSNVYIENKINCYEFIIKGLRIRIYMSLLKDKIESIKLFKDYEFFLSKETIKIIQYSTKSSSLYLNRELKILNDSI